MSAFTASSDLATATRALLVPIERRPFSQRRIRQVFTIGSQSEILARELDHRVKNILAMVVAIAHQTSGEPATLDSAAKAFSARIVALGEAQSILTNASWESVDLHLVVEGALDAHRFGASDPRFEIEGPAVQLPANKALSLALGIHELATNAVKYGSLSQNGGWVGIKWTLTEGQLQFEWVEHDGRL